MYQAKVTIGVLPTRRGMLDVNVAIQEKKKCMEIISGILPDVVRLVTIDDVVENGIIDHESKSPAAVAKFQKEKVDAIFVLFCDFGDEGSVADVVSKFQVPVLVWGERDQHPNSEQRRGRDTQCGMFAATKVLRRYGVKYSYIYNVEAESGEFRRGFDNFVRVTCVLKDLKNLRIGKIGEHPGPFRSVMTNEAALMTRFGIQTVAIAPVILQKTMAKILEDKEESFVSQVEAFRGRFDCSCVGSDGVEKVVALKLAIAQQLEANGCTAAAIECWPSCALLGMPACAAVSELTNEGIPVACETDINGAITMVILRACMLGKEPCFLADLTIRHPENDNAELLWHCGPFAYDLHSKTSSPKLKSGQVHFEMKQGSLTVCRFDDAEDGYHMFVGQGRSTTGPETTGTYVWMETDNWKAWEEKLMFGPYIHHLGGIYGEYLPVLKEVARYLDLHYDSPEQSGPTCIS